MVTQSDPSFTKVTAQSQLRGIETTHATVANMLASVGACADTAPTDLAEAGALRASLDAILATALQIEAELRESGRLAEFSHTLERCRLDARASLSAATTLYDSVVQTPRAAPDEPAALAALARETLSARDYHRERGRQLFTALVAMAGVGALVVAVAFLFVDARSSAWTSAIGRAALLVLVGWALRVVARAHTRHNDLAVWYQGRRTSLDTATLLLRSGATEVRDETLRQLLSAYVAAERGTTGTPPAAEGPATAPRPNLKQLITLVTPQRVPTPQPHQPN